MKTFKDAKRALTPEELIYYVINNPPHKSEMQEGDEYLIIEVLKIFGSKG